MFLLGASWGPRTGPRPALAYAFRRGPTNPAGHRAGCLAFPPKVCTLADDLARRAHHASSGRALPWILAGLLAAAAIGAGAFFLLRGAESEEEVAVTPPFEFELEDVRSVKVDGKISQEASESASEQITAVLSRLYDTAFVQPDQWRGGRFPSLRSYFAGRAARRAVRDLESLTLGADARRIERVRPELGTVEIDLLVDPDRQPYAAIAMTSFEAGGRTRGGQPLRIVHQGRYVVRPVEGSWLVVGYQVEGSVDAGPGGGTTP